jgi:hypothetical protein
VARRAAWQGAEFTAAGGGAAALVNADRLASLGLRSFEMAKIIYELDQDDAGCSARGDPCHQSGGCVAPAP